MVYSPNGGGAIWTIGDGDGAGLLTLHDAGDHLLSKIATSKAKNARNKAATATHHPDEVHYLSRLSFAFFPPNHRHTQCWIYIGYSRPEGLVREEKDHDDEDEDDHHDHHDHDHHHHKKKATKKPVKPVKQVKTKKVRMDHSFFTFRLLFTTSLHADDEEGEEREEEGKMGEDGGE